MRRRIAFFAAVFLLALVATLPLRVAAAWLGLDDRGLAAREAAGSVWSGHLSEAQLGRAPLGDLSARLGMLPLLIGKARVALARPGAVDPFEGALTASLSGFGVDDMTGRVRVAALFAPLPIAAIDLEDVSTGFSGGRCSRAEGQVRAMLSGEIAGIGLPSVFTGSVACAGDAVLIPFASQSGMERLVLRLFADGRYRIDLGVRPTGETMRAALTAAGFTPGNGAFERRIEGRF
jgi:general secretion pathway protein N